MRALPKIHRLELAHVHLPASHPAATRSASVPVHGYLIEHPDGPIVVDTGVGRGNAFIDAAYPGSRRALDEALREHGVELAQVAVVINSHLHFDHCGQDDLLYDGSATFYVQRAEVAAVEADAHYTVPAWALGPPERRRELDGDLEVADGVTILATPGHTAGHQSVLVEAGDERIVIGAQVVWHAEEYEVEVASDANVDPDDALRRAAVESIRRLKDLRPLEVHFSHCAPHIAASRAG